MVPLERNPAALAGVVAVSGFMYTPQLAGTLGVVVVVAEVTVPVAALGTALDLRVFRHVYLEELDKAWVDHLTEMDHLRDGIGLRGYGQKDPKQEYKKEGYNLFVNMVARVSSNVVT